MKTLVYILSCILWILIQDVNPSGALQCVYSNHTCNQGMKCEPTRKIIDCDEDTFKSINSCFTIWTRSDEGQEEEKLKGCFLNNKHCDHTSRCEADGFGKRNNYNGKTTYFCCCSQDLCNSNHSLKSTASESDNRDDTKMESEGTSQGVTSGSAWSTPICVILVYAVGVAGAVLMVGHMIVWQFCSAKPINENAVTMTEPTSQINLNLEAFQQWKLERLKEGDLII